MTPDAATKQLSQAAVSQMPGIVLREVDDEEQLDRLRLPLAGLKAVGAVTGLPSPRKKQDSDLLQTLDQIAFGIRDQSNYEYNYALMVVADPVRDREIAEAIHILRALGSDIHSSVNLSVQKTETTETGGSDEFDVGAGIGLLGLFIPGLASLEMFEHVGSLVNRLSASRPQGHSQSRSIGLDQIDKLGQYCEYVVDRHVTRFQQGRNLGFWSTGAYVLAETEADVRTLTGMLRSVYSGEESYLEPIRIHAFRPRSGVAEWINQFEKVPLPTETSGVEQGDHGWQHPLGRMYEAVATPLNTEELSITTSLPRRDVPGLRVVRNAVRFANNPPPLEASKDAITLGHVLDTGVSLSLDYSFDVNALVRHALVTGVTGSGKSTTCRRLLKEVGSRGLPMLVIEPAKDEYVRWAVEHNQGVPDDQRIRVYMPGGSDYYDEADVRPLRLNPFQPAQVGDKVDLASRAERFSAVLTASLPMADVLPLLLEESISELLKNQIDVNFADGEVPAPKEYPKLESAKLMARVIIEARGYEPSVTENLVAAVETRFQALSRGRRGQVLNVGVSTPFADLFERPVVINLNQITDDRDKALIMSLLIIALFEYRISRYHTDQEYKQRADDNHLCHLTVIEEAHRLLSNPQTDYAGIGNPQAVASGMFSEMLSEIRAYGQGLMIVDQVPARLIPDAIKNTNLKIVHRLVARDDRDAMASGMGLRPDQEDMIALLQLGEAIVCGDLDDAASWVKVRRT
jgi:DNA helicase HerA-like ATPase